jgi:hypothetical protein
MGGVLFDVRRRNIFVAFNNNFKKEFYFGTSRTC